MIKVLIAYSYNINRSFMFNFNFGEIKIIAIVIILIVVIIGLLIEIHNYKKINVKLSKQNKELIKRIKLLVGSSQDKSIITTMNNNYDYDSDDFEKNYAEQNKLYEEYKRIQATRPDDNEEFGRPRDYPKYTDKYDTHTDFTLRELLLLIWWGMFKKGRLVSAKITRYFIFDYNLNVRKVTQKFIDKGWLVTEDDRYLLSDKARMTVDFYSDLWEMHQSDEFPVCLDEDFPNWHHGKLLITFYKNEIEFQNKMIDFYKRLNSFYKNNPKFFSDKQMQDNHVQFIDESILEAQKDIERCQKLIPALE